MKLYRLTSKQTGREFVISEDVHEELRVRGQLSKYKVSETEPISPPTELIAEGKCDERCEEPCEEPCEPESLPQSPTPDEAEEPSVKRKTPKNQ